MKTMLIVLGLALFAIAVVVGLENTFINPVRSCTLADEFTSQAGSDTKYKEYHCPNGEVKYLIK